MLPAARRSLCALVALSLVAAPPLGAAQAPAGAASPAPVAGISEGVRLVLAGRWPEAVTELNLALTRLLPLRATRAPELAQAYLYRGVAEAAQEHEGRARESYRQALAVDPTIRLGGSFPPRALELFEAVRTKPPKAEPAASPADAAPSEAPATAPSAAAPEKRGGGTGHLLQMAGVAVLAGGGLIAGASALASHSSTSTGSGADGSVTVGASSGNGVISFERVNADPLPGSTISCATSCDRPRITLTVRSNDDLGANNLTVALFNDAGAVCSQSVPEPVDLAAGQTVQVNVVLRRTGACSLPTTVTRMRAITNPGNLVLSQEWFLTYVYTN